MWLDALIRETNGSPTSSDMHLQIASVETEDRKVFIHGLSQSSDQGLKRSMEVQVRGTIDVSSPCVGVARIAGLIVFGAKDSGHHRLPITLSDACFFVIDRCGKEIHRWQDSILLCVDHSPADDSQRKLSVTK